MLPSLAGWSVRVTRYGITKSHKTNDLMMFHQQLGAIHKRRPQSGGRGFSPMQAFCGQGSRKDF